MVFHVIEALGKSDDKKSNSAGKIIYYLNLPLLKTDENI